MAFRDDHEAALARVAALELELARARREASASRADAGSAGARVAELEDQVARLRAKPPDRVEPVASRPATTPVATTAPARPISRQRAARIKLVLTLILLVILVVVLLCVPSRRGSHASKIEPSPSELERQVKQRHDEDCRLCQEAAEQGRVLFGGCGCR